MSKMKRNKTIAFMLLLTLFMWSAAGCSNDELYSSSKITSDLSIADDVKAFYDAVDIDYAYDLTYELSYNWDELAEPLGWRTAGSDSEHKAAEYLAKEMKKIGLKNIEKLPTTCDKFQNNGTSLSIKDSNVNFKGGSQKAVEAGTNGPAPYQVKGTDGDLTTQIIDVGSGVESDYEGKDVNGKIVLAHVDLANEYWIDSYIHEAKNHGAAAIVTWADSGYGELDTSTAAVNDVCCGDVIPAVAISANQAKQIKSALKEGHNICTLNINTEKIPRGGTTYNVCGMIPGKNHAEKIIISGHYDKYWYGFQDDCAAIGLVFAVAKAMVDSGYEPENDIYFICHGAEEWGVSDSIFDWAAGAWGMVNEYNMADNVRAMLNFELPAFKREGPASISSVPEYFDMIEKMFTTNLLVTAGDVKISTEPELVNTMEDGISYREYGAPYIRNCFTGDIFMTERYHTKADNKDTYDADTFLTNINWTGAYAIYFDKEPALELNIANAATMLKDNLDEDVAKEAGVDIDKYLAAVDDMEKSGQNLYEKAVACNENYEKALADNDQKAANACKDEARKLNQINLDAFQLINEQLLKVTDSTALYGHPLYNDNVKKLDGVIAGLENGEIWTDEETGAGDYAWQLNNMLEYSYMYLTMDNGNRQIKINTPLHYADKNHAQWGWTHLYELTNTGAATYELTHAETINDIKNIKAMIKTYEDAKKRQLSLIRSECTRELSVISTINQSLGGN